MSDLFVLLALAAVIASASFLSSNAVAWAEGDSMQPTFSECTLLVVDKKAGAMDLAQGDIAVVDISGQEAEFDEIVHRVVENRAEQQEFSTRGDNSAYYEFPSSIDGYFPYEKFLGKVTAYYNLPEFFCSLKGGEK